AELASGAVDEDPHGRPGQPQLVGDDLVAVPPAEEPQHLRLPAREAPGDCSGPGADADQNLVALVLEPTDEEPAAARLELTRCARAGNRLVDPHHLGAHSASRPR